MATCDVQGARSVHECDAEKRLRTERDLDYGRTHSSRQHSTVTARRHAADGDCPSGVNVTPMRHFFPSGPIVGRDLRPKCAAVVEVAGRLHYFIGISIRYVFASLPETGHHQSQ